MTISKSEKSSWIPTEIFFLILHIEPIQKIILMGILMEAFFVMVYKN